VTEESKENANYNSPPRAGIHTGYHHNELQTDYSCVPHEACPDMLVMELSSGLNSAAHCRQATDTAQNALC
jgi:hypothetical protein